VTSQLWWYVARATGIVGWTLLAASVVWGLTMTSRSRPRAVRAGWVLELHRYLGGLATIFVGVHVAGIVADSYTHFGPSDLLVPFASSWRPWAVAWGIASMYLLVAIELTSLAKRQLPPRLWRSVHFASFPLFATSTIHALAAGTDTGNRLFKVVLIAVTALVIGLTARRVDQAPGRRSTVSRETSSSRSM
jgi:ferric reductase like protein